MIEILGKSYITDKEAAERFHYSQSWFEQRRLKKKPPPYIKLNGKVLYEVSTLDNWFKSQMKEF